MKSWRPGAAAAVGQRPACDPAAGNVEQTSFLARANFFSAMRRSRFIAPSCSLLPNPFDLSSLRARPASPCHPASPESLKTCNCFPCLDYRPGSVPYLFFEHPLVLLYFLLLILVSFLTSFLVILLLNSFVGKFVLVLFCSSFVPFLFPFPLHFHLVQFLKFFSSFFWQLLAKHLLVFTRPTYQAISEDASCAFSFFFFGSSLESTSSFLRPLLSL